MNFVRTELPSFASEQAAEDLYDRFRNGLAHEARLKNGAEFSLEEPSTYARIGQVARINPSMLLTEVRDALARFVALVSVDDVPRQQFADILQADSAYELSGTQVSRAAS